MKFSELKVGMTASSSKTITSADVVMFAGVSTDCNPLHLSDEAAKEGIFGKRVAHGMLSASLISAVLGTKLPGEGTVYMGQTLRFKKPVFLDDTVKATVTIKELIPEKNRVILDTVCTVNRDGVDVVVIDGEATTYNK